MKKASRELLKAVNNCEDNSLQKNVFQQIANQIEQSPNTSDQVKEETVRILKDGIKDEFINVLHKSHHYLEHVTDYPRVNMNDVVNELTGNCTDISQLSSIIQTLVAEGIASPAFNNAVEIIKTML